MINSDKHPKSGFEDEPKDAWPKPCLDPHHEPPRHMVVPAGKIYRHICPACGAQVILRSNSISMKA